MIPPRARFRADHVVDHTDRAAIVIRAALPSSPVFATARWRVTERLARARLGVSLALVCEQ